MLLDPDYKYQELNGHDLALVLLKEEAPAGIEPVALPTGVGETAVHEWQKCQEVKNIKDRDIRG